MCNAEFLEPELRAILVDLYYIAFPGDKLVKKSLVAFLYVMELVQVVMATHDAFAALASGWGAPGALDHIYWSCVDVPIMSSISKYHINLLYMITQSFRSELYYSII